MSSDLMWQTTSIDFEATIRLGESLGKKVRGGEVIELISDIGGGKTTFVKGLVRGAGSTDQVASPSFTISREYHAADKTIYHLDFYRLADPGIMMNELQEFLDDSKAIVVIEWADIVDDVLPADRLQISITTQDTNTRIFEYKYPEKLQYLLKEET